MTRFTKIAAWTTSGLLMAGLAAGVAEARSGTGGAAVSGATGGAGASIVRLPALTSGASADQWAQGRRHPRLALLRRTVHGEVVLRTKSGYTTVDLRRGRVSAISPTSITLASPDGTSQTFAIDASTRVRIDRQPSTASAITTADRALAVAVKDGGLVARLIVVRTPGFRANAAGTPTG